MTADTIRFYDQKNLFTDDKLQLDEASYSNMYHVVTPLGKDIPTSVPPAQIDNSVPTEEGVEWEVRRLRGHQLGGPYCMHADHLREWLREHWAKEVATEADDEGVNLETEGRERGP